MAEYFDTIVKKTVISCFHCDEFDYNKKVCKISSKELAVCIHCYQQEH
jgi:hypothetical protein